ncbi:MAG: hypothetical protein LBQ78_01725 [Tannerellaceae bacterium]|nr:hypothetical protein [Tannerellaceae bacterium]
MKTKVKLFYHFSAGFLSVFFLFNPLSIFPKKSSQSKDSEKLSKDWNNIGNDIIKSYEQFKSEHS